MSTSNLVRPAVAAVIAMLLTAPATAQPAENVLSHIPADCAGFVVINNLADTSAKIDKFIADIGLGQMMPGSILPMLKAQLQMTQGLNDNAGAALVALDPAQFGWDVKTIENLPRAGGPDRLPLALLIPGNNPREIFANFEPVEENGYVKVNLSDETWLTKAIGGYTVLAPSEQAIEAVVSSVRPAAIKIGPDHRAVLATCDIAAFVDMKMLAPYFASFIDSTEQEMKEAVADEFTPAPVRMIGSIYGNLLPFYRNLLIQAEAVTFGLRLSKTGLILEEFVRYQPDSDLAKMLAAVKPASGPLLDKLPVLPHVMAFDTGSSLDMTGQQTLLYKTLVKGLLDAFLTSDEKMAGVSEETKDLARQIADTFIDQVTGAQGYLGRDTAAEGVFGASVVLDVKDANAMMGVFPDLVKVTNELAKAMLAEIEELKDLSIRYVEGVASVDGVSVNAVDVECPVLADLQEAIPGGLATILGQDAIRFHVAAVDPGTVVVTFGGGEALLAEAVKAVRAGRPLTAHADVAAAMKELPANLTSVGFFSPANLVDLIKDAVAAAAPPEQAEQAMGMLEMFSFQTRTPIAVGAAVRPTGQHQRTFVPIGLIAEGVQKVMMLPQIFMQGSGGGQSDQPPEEDF